MSSLFSWKYTALNKLLDIPLLDWNNCYQNQSKDSSSSGVFVNHLQSTQKGSFCLRWAWLLFHELSSLCWGEYCHEIEFNSSILIIFILFLERGPLCWKYYLNAFRIVIMPLGKGGLYSTKDLKLMCNVCVRRQISCINPSSNHRREVHALKRSSRLWQQALRTLCLKAAIKPRTIIIKTQVSISKRDKLWRRALNLKSEVFHHWSTTNS